MSPNLNNFIIVSSTYHDPLFRLREMLLTCLDFMTTHFKDVNICLTPTTSPQAIDFLEKKGFKVHKCNNSSRVNIYNSSLKQALDSGNLDNKSRILCIDFDRLLHWIAKYPKELKGVLYESHEVDYLHLGRTSRAFDSHPRTQILTESVINKLCSKTLGFGEDFDMISVCSIMTQSLAKGLLKINHHSPTGIYYNWPLYLWKHAESSKYLEVEGLEWETPDQYQPEILKEGYEKWLETFQSSEQWIRRVDFIRDCVEEISHIADFQIKSQF